MTLEEAKKHINRLVIYTPFEGCSSKEKESGVITAVNSRFVFVRYGSDVIAKATKASDLELML